MTYKLKLSACMAEQVEDDNLTFETEHIAYAHGIERFGSSGYNEPCGWDIEKIQE